MSQRKSIIDRIPWAFQGYPDVVSILKDSVEWESKSFTQAQFENPFFGLITPMWNTPLRYLEELIESCQAQSFPSWELILVDDGSRDKAHVELAKEFAKSDPRIKVFDESINRGISGARNFAISKATAKYLAILDHDDILHPRILAHFFKILESKAWSLVYCNEVKIDQASQRLSQFFYKPEFDGATLLRSNYVAHFAAVCHDKIKTLAGRDGEIFRSQFDGAEDHDYFLRLSNLDGFTSFHTSVFGYLWRKSASSTASSLDAKPYVKERLHKLLVEHSHKSIEIHFPESDGERYPAVYSPGEIVKLERLLIWVWGKNRCDELKTLLNQTYPPIKYEFRYSDNIPSGLEFNEWKTSESSGNWIVILDGTLSDITCDSIMKAITTLSGLSQYGSLGIRILDKDSNEIGDIAIDYAPKGEITLRSQLTETDFPADQRMARLPMPYFLVARDVPDQLVQGDLGPLLSYIRSRMLYSSEHRHFYDGRAKATSAHANLWPEKINWNYEDHRSRLFKDHLIRTSMVYDPDQRWLHASRIDSDWYEVPRRYQLADGINEKLKKFTKPVHQLVKKLMK